MRSRVCPGLGIVRSRVCPGLGIVRSKVFAIELGFVLMLGSSSYIICPVYGFVEYIWFICKVYGLSCWSRFCAV